MFYVLQINNRKNTVINKLFGIFRKDKYTVQTVPVYKGAPFMIMTVTAGKHCVDWNELSQILGKCARRLVVSNGIELPENSNMGCFKSDILRNKILQNTFLNIMENNVKKSFVTISVLDTKGECTDFVKKISKYAETLTVTTKSQKNYLKLFDNIMDENGMCPVISKDFDDAKIKINCDKNVMTIDNEGNYVNIINGVDFKVPEIYEKLQPDYVNKYDFYSALYELCGVFSLSDCIFNTVLVNNEKKSVTDIHFT